MKKTVTLWKNTPGLCRETPTLDIYIPENRLSDIAVMILPGGGYEGRAPKEGEGYARFLNSQGIAAFVCQYRVSPHRFPLPLLDARRAVRYVRYHSREFGIDPQKVYLMGSSAGGHLAALTSTYRGPIDHEGLDAIDRESCFPNGQILCYPVISFHDLSVAHVGSVQNLLESNDDALRKILSPDLIADRHTPKAFIWHTFDDPGGDVRNSLNYAARLRQVNVPVEMHLYPHGPHGMDLAVDDPHVKDWSARLMAWLKYNETNKEN